MIYLYCMFMASLGGYLAYVGATNDIPAMTILGGILVGHVVVIGMIAATRLLTRSLERHDEDALTEYNRTKGY